jgi:hypothetical protein
VVAVAVADFPEAEVTAGGGAVVAGNWRFRMKPHQFLRAVDHEKIVTAIAGAEKGQALRFAYM